jgi:HTH-type transcriptional regulator/antitoxin HigA
MVMKTLKYTVIKNITQYRNYCLILEDLTSQKRASKSTQNEIDLLTLLIEKWDKDQQPKRPLEPVRLIKSLMIDHKLKAKDLAHILGVSKGYLSDILNHKKGFSKRVIRELALYFKISQEAMNSPKG